MGCNQVEIAEDVTLGQVNILQAASFDSQLVHEDSVGHILVGRFEHSVEAQIWLRHLGFAIWGCQGQNDLLEDVLGGAGAILGLQNAHLSDGSHQVGHH